MWKTHSQLSFASEKGKNDAYHAELADLLSRRRSASTNVRPRTTNEAFFEEIRNALECGDGVKLSGFGSFQLRDKPQRPGRNRRPARSRSPRDGRHFHASQKLKAEVEHAYDGSQP
ncbi:MAG: HU family DNA-binding protein [Candidatus Accumulibacter sp.]|nr:HU family DNA-binding protein [Accumulibacter sp.]